LVFIGLIGVFIVSSSPSTETEVKADNSSELSMDNVSSEMNNGSLLVDVRTPEEFVAGYIEEAINLPLDKIQAGQTPEVETNKPLYVYCRSGNRSAEATKLLLAAGYTNVIDLGGINDVVAIGGKQVR
jgi:phage shock protein E